jgi:uncharacterized protein (DUF58 family)
LLVLSLLFYALLLAGLGLLQPALLALALPLGVYWLAALWLLPGEVSLSARRSLSTTRLTEGGPVDVRLEIENQGDPVDLLWFNDLLQGGMQVMKGKPGRLVSMKRGETLVCEYTINVPRGVFVYDALEVWIGDGLGLAVRTVTLPAEGMISVLPRAPKLSNLNLRPEYTHGYHGTIPARRGGAGVAFFGVRDYQPGDALRQVNWRLGARHPDALYSNEFQVEAAADVGLVLDGRQENYLSLGGQGLFEYAIQAAASLAQTFLVEGNRVGLLSFGHAYQWTQPGYGKVQIERIFQALAALQPGVLHTEMPESLPAHFARPGSQLVVISPLNGWDVGALLRLRARRYSLLVISPNPSSFEYLHLRPGAPRDLAKRIAHLERQQLLLPLRQAGVPVLDWEITITLDQALNHLRRGALGPGLPAAGAASPGGLA